MDKKSNNSGVKERARRTSGVSPDRDHLKPAKSPSKELQSVITELAFGEQEPSQVH